MVEPTLVARFCSYCGADIQAVAECLNCGMRNEFLNVPPPDLGSGRTGEDYGAPQPVRSEAVPPPAPAPAQAPVAEAPAPPPAAQSTPVQPAAPVPATSPFEAVPPTAPVVPPDVDDVTSPLELDDRTMPLPAEAHPVVAILLCEEGHEDDLRFELRAGEAVLGRKNAPFVVKSEHVSTRHACFYTGRSAAGAAEVTVADLGSVNGTFVNGKRLAPQERQPLSDNDVVKIANITFLFRENSPSS